MDVLWLNLSLDLGIYVISSGFVRIWLILVFIIFWELWVNWVLLIILYFFNFVEICEVILRKFGYLLESFCWIMISIGYINRIFIENGGLIWILVEGFWKVKKKIFLFKKIYLYLKRL